MPSSELPFMVGIVIVVDAAKCLQQFGEERQPMLRYLM